MAPTSFAEDGDVFFCLEFYHTTTLRQTDIFYNVGMYLLYRTLAIKF